MKAITSGNAIARLLNDHLIVLDRVEIVREVLYADSTDDLLFSLRDGTFLTFPRHRFSESNFDEHDGHMSFVVYTNDNVAYNVAVYRNKSDAVLRDIETYF